MKDEELPDLITWEPLQEDEIHILVLLPSKDYNAPLQGRIERRKLVSQETLSIEHDDGGYEVISYCWGAPDDPRQSSIFIDGTGLPIWFKLEFALKRIRKQEERRIWIEPICISPFDSMERSHQVPKISQIFRSAERVLVWLDEESEDSAGALEFLYKVAKATKIHDELTSDAFVAGWKSVEELLMHQWFAGNWIHELSMARHATVLHGIESLDWTLFLTAIHAFIALVSSGHLFDEVDTVTDVHDKWNTPFPKSWLSMKSMNDVPQFIHTLLAGSGDVDMEHCMELGRYIKKVADEEDDEENYSRRLSSLSECAADFEKLRALTKGRRLFKSKRRVVNGLGPASMETGDCNPAPGWHRILFH